MGKRVFLMALVSGSLLAAGCGRSLCRREPSPRGYGSGGPTYSLPPQNIPDGPPPPSSAARNRPSGGAELLLPESLPPG